MPTSTLEIVCAGCDLRPCECCSRCGQHCDECECCSTCEQTEHDCTCSICEGCNGRFDVEDANTCCRAYCSYRCAERNYHRHCSRCDEARDSCDMFCSECGCSSCCVGRWCERDDCTCCRECCSCEPEPTSCIRSYSCREYPAARPAGLSLSACGLGVELEVECPNDDAEGVAQLIHDRYDEQILLKEDGSLNNGFELVTGRYSLDEQQQLWPKLARLAAQSGARSWKHSTTGLHVHLSRRAFTPLSLSKFVLFFNAPDTQQMLRIVAGRSESSYAKVQHKKIGTAHRNTQERYQAVNLCNSRTVEVRIFKGTLDALHILADIELCHAAWAYTLDCSIAEAESWPAFWNFVLRNKKPYARLIEFLNRKGE